MSRSDVGPESSSGDVQIVGALTDEVVRALGIATGARSVAIHPLVVQHIEQRRGVDTAAFVFQYLSAAVARPTWVAIHNHDPRRVRIVHLIEFDGRYLYVALKFVPAAVAHSQGDEWWVSTAYPLAASRLTRLRARAKFIEVAVSESGPD